MSELERKVIEYATHYYYGEPLISDEEFDNLVDALRLENPDSPVLSSVGWGADLEVSPLDKVIHPYTVLRGLPKRKVTPDYVLDSGVLYLPKIDGLSVELIYQDGIFNQAITRGNGTTGLDVTDKLKWLVPFSISTGETMSIRGEFCLDYHNFNKYYSDNPSPRNVASGVLNRKSVDPAELRRFTVLIYKPIAMETLQALCRYEFLEFCESEGFRVVDTCTPLKPMTYQEVFSRYIDIYPMDGIVAVPSYERPRTLEDSSYCILDDSDEVAYKIVTDTGITTVTGIDINLTRTGKLVPTIVYEPIELSGATLSRVAGSNFRYLIDNGVGVGATIEIVRSGEVIPYIVEVHDRVDAELPTKCPACNGTLVFNGTDLICPHTSCPAKDEYKVYHWIRTNGSVDGLGTSLITAFVEYFNIFTVFDIYEITTEDIRNMDCPGVGGRKLELLCQMRERLDHVNMTAFLVGLNLTGLSWKSAERLSSRLLVDSLMNHDLSKVEELVYTKGVMRKTSEDIMENVSYIADLVRIVPSIEFDNEPSTTTTGKLRICYTGKTVNYKTKKDFYTDLANHIEESDVKSCDYLVCNVAKNSSKEKYAKSHDIKIVTEAELLAIILK